jgi:serine O-acetyltransferase
MDCDHQHITEQLLRSYQEVGGINHLEGKNLPSKQIVEHLCEEGNVWSGWQIDWRLKWGEA